ncbi:MAG TPA: hypothetical protein VFV77_01655 [Gammaproteobacteria bacterium]|nr:hypothetical protein [Gammaproteobacteria bacterium]
MPKPDLEPLNLGSIAKGAALELFAKAIEEVAANIADTDTEATATREIALIFKIKPEGDRRTLQVTSRSKIKLAAVADHSSRAYIGKDAAGKPYVFDQDPRQETLFDPPPKDRENIIDFNVG